MKKIITGDNSVTYYSERYQEYYHSKSGALEEAFVKFAKPSKLNSVDKEKVAVLDVCFGLGYNFLAGLVELMKNDAVKEIRMAGIENDARILEKAKAVLFDFEEHRLIRELISKKRMRTEYRGKILMLDLILEDARTAVDHLPRHYFDFVFHDPFSPKKCPELWTEMFFRKIAMVTRKNAVLTTYSCARIVRDNLIKSGFTIKDGPKIHRRGPSTIAIK